MGIIRRRLNQREQGVALVAVIVMVAVIGALSADFAFGVRVDYAAAANARDELRAHYLNRSALNLGRLLLRMQTQLIEPNRQLLGGFDLQLPEYASTLLAAFQGGAGAELLGGLFGVEPGAIRGLGLGAGRFSLAMQSLDGRLNLNCAGGPNPGAPAVVRLAAGLAALFAPRRYDRLFERQDERGQYNDRLTVLRAIIDWADQDQQLFGSSAAEDYRYEEGKDGYHTKNQYFDTLEELRLVRGVDEEFMTAFADQLTVYGGCRLNVALLGTPLIMALIAQYAAVPTDPGLEYRNLALLARYVYEIGQLRGFSSVKALVDAVEDPMGQLSLGSAIAGVLTQGKSEPPAGLPPVTGVKLSPKIEEAVVAGQPRRVWRMVAQASVGRVEKRLTAVWDQGLISMQAGRAGSGPGGFVYWREE